MKKRVRWLLLTLTLLIMYHPQTVEASDDKTMKTYTWGTRDDFKKLINSDTYKKYGSKFNFSESELYVKGYKEPIDLEETIQIGETDTNVYKYQFWVRSNNLKNNSWCWKTEFYMGTRNPVGDGSNPSSYVAKGTKIERLEAKEKTGTFFKSEGEGTTASGDSGTAEYGLTLYVVDVEEYVKEMWREETFEEYVYLHAVTKTYKGDTPQAYTSGTASNNFSMDAWMKATLG